MCNNIFSNVFSNIFSNIFYDIDDVQNIIKYISRMKYNEEKQNRMNRMK